MSDQPRRTYAEMNRTERLEVWLGLPVLGLMVGVVCVVGLSILLAPGMIYDWRSERLAGDPESFPIAAARDGVTWVISLMVWAGLGVLVWSYRYWPNDFTSEEDEDFDEVDYDEHEDTPGQSPDPDVQRYNQPRAAEPPFVDDDLASLCTDKACAEALGLSGRCTMKDVRSAYWRKIAEYHPGKVAHLGPKLRELAEVESKRLNTAYQYFEEHHGQAAPAPEDDGLAGLCTDAACAEALGIDTTYVITIEKVRKAYREQIVSYHPDKVAHLGPKLRDLAELESKRLNMAHQYFERRYREEI